MPKQKPTKDRWNAESNDEEYDDEYDDEYESSDSENKFESGKMMRNLKSAAKDDLRRMIAQGKRKKSEITNSAREKMDDWKDWSHHQIEDNPGKTAMIAAIAGVVVGVGIGALIGSAEAKKIERRKWKDYDQF